MLHLLIALFAFYLLACYAWGVYVTVRLVVTRVRRVRKLSASDAPEPLAKITPQTRAESAEPKRHRKAA